MDFVCYRRRQVRQFLHRAGCADHLSRGGLSWLCRLQVRRSHPWPQVSSQLDTVMSVSGEVMWPTKDDRRRRRRLRVCGSHHLAGYAELLHHSSLAVRGRAAFPFVNPSLSPNAVVNSSASHNIMQGLRSAGNLLLLPAVVAPCTKHDTSSKHSYTVTLHISSQATPWRCRLSNSIIQQKRVPWYTGRRKSTNNPMLYDRLDVTLRHQASRAALSSLTCILNM
jgi:hypothetical protein